MGVHHQSAQTVSDASKYFITVLTCYSFSSVVYQHLDHLSLPTCMCSCHVNTPKNIAIKAVWTKCLSHHLKIDQMTGTC